MKRNKYRVNDLWKDLENNISSFQKNNDTPVSNDGDAEAYALCRNTMQEMLLLGSQAESLSFFSHPIQKAKLGLRAKSLFQQRFELDQPPPLKGLKSLEFIRDVIVPFLNDSQKLAHERWLIHLCNLVGIDLVKEQQAAAILSKQCQDIIKQNDSKYLQESVTLKNECIC